MNIVFGKIVGDFNSYSLPDTTLNEETFKSSVNKSRLDLRIEFSNLPRSPVLQFVHRLLVHRQIRPHVYCHGGCH